MDEKAESKSNNVSNHHIYFSFQFESMGALGKAKKNVFLIGTRKL
jgi:hypothetical protein